MGAEAAARLGDDIAHGFGLAAMVAGAVVGAVVGAAVIGATAATGGLAAVIIAGAVAGGGLSMLGIVRGLTTIFHLPEPSTGTLMPGSKDVLINGRPAMRASVDGTASCNGFPNHLFMSIPSTIAQGSATVLINGLPAARLKDKLVCGAHIKGGSPNVVIGGPTETTNFIFDLESWTQTGLEVLGLAALAGGAVLAAMTGAVALGSFGALTGISMAGFEELGQLGDALGPGYRDLLQGIAGMALLFTGLKAGRPPSEEVPPGRPPREPPPERLLSERSPQEETTETPQGARGPSSRRDFDPDKAGGPIVPKSLDDVTITHEGVDQVQAHLSRFEQSPFNDAMMARQRAIADGKLEPTIEDKAFHAHELDEYQRYQNMGYKEGVPEGVAAQHELWNNTHTAALEDYSMSEVVKDPMTGQIRSTLYHPSCDSRVLPEDWTPPPGYPFNK